MFANKHLLNAKPFDPTTAMKIIKSSIVICFCVLIVADLLVLVGVWPSIKCINMLKLLVNQYCSVIFAPQLLLVKMLLKHICVIITLSQIKDQNCLIISYVCYLHLL